MSSVAGHNANGACLWSMPAAGPRKELVGKKYLKACVFILGGIGTAVGQVFFSILYRSTTVLRDDSKYGKDKAPAATE